MTFVKGQGCTALKEESGAEVEVPALWGEPLFSEPLFPSLKNQHSDNYPASDSNKNQIC